MKWKTKSLKTEAELKVHKKFAFLPTVVSYMNTLYYVWFESYYMFQTAIYDELGDCVNTDNYRYLNKYDCISMCKIQMEKGKCVL